METKLNPILINRAVEIYATQPNVHHKDVANELGINPKTLKNSEAMQISGNKSMIILWSPMRVK